jgi:sugar lactone lactonase YvrE
MKNNLLLLLLICPLFVRAQTITTIAGTDSAGYNGDGINATLSELDRPFSLAVNNSGNVYIADRYNNRVRMINASGIIATIAGTGVGSYSGDGGPATGAGVNAVTGVAADAGGVIYIADKGNEKVRKISAAGLISTLAGNGMAGYSGDGGSAAAAELNNPNGVAVDNAGNVYIADQGNSRIRKVTPAGIISTIAGTGANGYNGDNMAATAAQLYNPYAVAVDRAGNIYISDVDNDRIRKVTAAGIISTIAGTGVAGNSGAGGPATAAELSEPIGVAVDSAGNVYIADAWNSRICVVNTFGTLNAVAGNGTAGFSGDGGPANQAELYLPYGVAVDRSGIYIADYGNNRIRQVNYSPTSVNTIAHSSSLEIYPDPAPGNFSILMSSGVTETAQITITGATGRIIRQMTAATNKTIPIMMNDAVPGLYFVAVVTSNGKWTGPIVITSR